MTAELRSFEYSTEQWSEVVAAMPPTKAADAELMRLVRKQLEAALSGYENLTHAHRRRFAEGSPAKAMLQAHDQIKAALDYADQTHNALLQDSLGKALKIMYATTAVEAFDMLRRSRKGRTDPARDLLDHLVLKAWTDTLAGVLTTGRKSNAATGKREANSPAIRFLIAALKPVTSVGPERAKKIIRAESSGRDALRKQIAALRIKRAATNREPWRPVVLSKKI